MKRAPPPRSSFATKGSRWGAALAALMMLSACSMPVAPLIISTAEADPPVLQPIAYAAPQPQPFSAPRPLLMEALGIHLPPPPQPPASEPTPAPPPLAADLSPAASPSRHYALAPTRHDRDCIARAMLFEALSQDHDSLLAVGTIVANRADSPRYPHSWCAVVQQGHQFTSNPMKRFATAEALQVPLEVADELIDGLRHPKLSGVYYFYTTGYRAPRGARLVGDVGGNTYYRLPADDMPRTVATN